MNSFNSAARSSLSRINQEILETARLKHTGQLFFRETGMDHKGKPIYMVCGTIASNDVKGEHRYDVSLQIEGGEDLTKEARGNDMGGLLCALNWRV